MFQKIAAKYMNVFVAFIPRKKPTSSFACDLKQGQNYVKKFQEVYRRV